MTWLLVYALGFVAMFVFLALTAMFMLYIERKVLGRLQQRLGPMRTGPYGILQTVADAMKLLLKEMLRPNEADRLVYVLGPVLVLTPTLLIWVAIPFAPGLVLRNLDLGLFYIVAISVLSILGLVAAGWSSANKYALLGSARSAAQLISYEIPMVLVILSVVVLAQTMNLTELVKGQTVPYLLFQPLGFFLFLTAGLAEVGRTPFDIPHADSEVVGGPYIEYSGIQWALINFSEYVHTFATAALITLLFLSGWKGFLLPPVIWFFIKTYIVVLVIFWFRGTFPRFRIDQLMGLAWKGLVPLAFLNLFLNGLALAYGWPSYVLAIINWLLVLGLAFGVVGPRLRWRWAR